MWLLQSTASLPEILRKREIASTPMQDDLLYESLTVWETLWFAAQLRLPRTMTKAAKRERVNTVITALGLTRCRDTIIGECSHVTELIETALRKAI